MFCKEAGKGAAEESQIRSALRIVQLARENNRLSTAEVKQNLYCQDRERKEVRTGGRQEKFPGHVTGEITVEHAETSMQTSMQGKLPVNQTVMYQSVPVFSQLETDRR